MDENNRTDFNNENEVNLSESNNQFSSEYNQNVKDEIPSPESPFVSEYKTQGNFENESKEQEFGGLPNIFFGGFFIRMFAYIVDMMIISAIDAIILNPILNLNIFANNMIFEEISSVVLFLLYFSLMTFFTNGQTLGKMIFGIRVVQANGEKLSLSTVVIREVVGRFIMYKLPILYIIAAFSTRKQHFVDMLTDTSVVIENMLKAQSYDCEKYKLS